MTHNLGLALNAETPSTGLYLGSITPAAQDTTVVKYNYIIPNYTATIGFEDTNKLATTGMTRINTFINKNISFKLDLKSSGLLNNDEDGLISSLSLE
jgi:hypothetical protein